MSRRPRETAAALARGGWLIVSCLIVAFVGITLGLLLPVLLRHPGTGDGAGSDLARIARGLKEYSQEYGQYPYSDVDDTTALDVLITCELLEPECLHPTHAVPGSSRRYWYLNRPDVAMFSGDTVVVVMRIELLDPDESCVWVVSADGEAFALGGVVEHPELLLQRKIEALRSEFVRAEK